MKILENMAIKWLSTADARKSTVFMADVIVSDASPWNAE